MVDVVLKFSGAAVIMYGCTSRHGVGGRISMVGRIDLTSCSTFWIAVRYQISMKLQARYFLSPETNLFLNKTTIQDILPELHRIG